MERVVLGRKENSTIGFRWSGAEPEGLDDVGMEVEFGAVREGDELVSYDMDALKFQIDRLDEQYLEDND